MNNNLKKILTSKVSLAPMAGITDYVLRNLIRNFSKSCLITTEMISSESLVHVQDTHIVKTDETERPISFQLSGHKPRLLLKAAKMLEEKADMIDINMGCPVNKVVRGQDGSALMRNPQLAFDIVKTLKSELKIPVSVKFRLGYTVEEMNYVEFGEKMQEAGADLITIHARTRSQMYSGKADWLKIKELKKNVDIPVFANGDVTSIETAQRCLELSCADGIAIARGVLGDITLIHRIEHFLDKNEILPPPSLDEKIQHLKLHLKSEIEFRGEDVGVKFMRKFYPYYIKSINNAAKYRYALTSLETYDEVLKVLEEIQQDAIIQHAEAILQ